MRIKPPVSSGIPQKKKPPVSVGFNRIEQRLTALEVTLWGQRGDNGIKATINELRVKMDVLLRFFWIASAIPPLTLVLLAILKFLGKL